MSGEAIEAGMMAISKEINVRERIIVRRVLQTSEEFAILFQAYQKSISKAVSGVISMVYPGIRPIMP
jgi:hypothetical protein